MSLTPTMASLLRWHRARQATATVAALAMLATVPTAHAAKFWTEPGTCIDGSKDCVDVHLKGPIEKGDVGRFEKATATTPKDKATVYLDSIGGATDMGLAIGMKIRHLGWATYVDANTNCFSACANIWLAGKPRYINRTARLGFHSSSMKVGSHVRNDRGNAIILKYYHELGVSAEAGRVFVALDPDHLIWLTPDLAINLGISLAVWPFEGAATAQHIERRSYNIVSSDPIVTVPKTLEAAQKAEGAKTPSVPPASDQASGSRPQASTIKPVTAHTGWIVQVGALESEDGAQKLIEAARNSAHGLLNRADPFTEPVIANDGRKLYRARFAGLERDQAEAVCRTLRRSDISCLLVSN